MCDSAVQQCVYVVFIQPYGYEDSIHNIVAVYRHEDAAKTHVAGAWYKFDYEAWPLVDGRT